jgi:8-oxo-dGTP pyrophosphatase MutT (NUDIX family)
MAKPRTGPSRRILQAGALICRTSDSGTEILLVRAKKTPDVWVFPKGHLEQYESLEEAALREAFEEAGIAGVVVGPVGRPLEFQSGQEAVRVQYLLVYARTETSSSEGRPKKWCSIDEALLLTHPDASDLLRTVRRELEWWTEPAKRDAARSEVFTEHMRAEFEHLAASLISNEESGEKRVNMFIAVSGGVGAALGLLIGKDAVFDVEKEVTVIVALIVLLTLGYATLLRVVTRNAASDQYKRRLNRVRQYFLEGPDDVLRHVLPFEPFEPASRRPASARALGRGGWFETMALVEAVIAGGLGAMVMWAAVHAPLRGMPHSQELATLLASLSGVALAGVAWRLVIARGNALFAKEIRKTPPEHVGYAP